MDRFQLHFLLRLKNHTKSLKRSQNICEIVFLSSAFPMGQKKKTPLHNPSLIPSLNLCSMSYNRDSSAHHELALHSYWYDFIQMICYETRLWRSVQVSDTTRDLSAITRGLRVWSAMWLKWRLNTCCIKCYFISCWIIRVKTRSNLSICWNCIMLCVTPDSKEDKAASFSSDLLYRLVFKGVSPEAMK